jgi:hypothetical protein
VPLAQVVGCAVEHAGQSRHWCTAECVCDTFSSNYAIPTFSRRTCFHGNSTTGCLPAPLPTPSLMQVVQQQQAWAGAGQDHAASCSDFLQQLGYREYSRYLSFHFPFITERSLLAHLRAVPWRLDVGAFKVGQGHGQPSRGMTSALSSMPAQTVASATAEQARGSHGLLPHHHSLAVCCNTCIHAASASLCRQLKMYIGCFAGLAAGADRIPPH